MSHFAPRLAVLALVAPLGLLLGSTPPARAARAAPPSSDPSVFVSLIAGRSTVAGSVSIEKNATDLVVTVVAGNGWSLEGVKTAVASDASGIPQTRKGNPIPGKFGYKSGDLGGASTYILTISLDSLPAGSLVLAVKAELTHGSKSEGAWAEGTPFNAHNPGMYVEIGG